MRDARVGSRTADSTTGKNSACITRAPIPKPASSRLAAAMSAKNSVAVCRLVGATAIVGLMLPLAVGESEEELRQTHASASFVDEG